MKTFLTLFFLISSVSALNDLNLTIDPQNTNICISNSDLTKYSCQLNETLLLNGTSDVYLKLIPKPSLYRNDTLITKLQFFVLTPIETILFLSILLFSLIGGLGAIWILSKFVVK